MVLFSFLQTTEQIWLDTKVVFDPTQVGNELTALCNDDMMDSGLSGRNISGLNEICKDPHCLCPWPSPLQMTFVRLKNIFKINENLQY